jgi:hypothetical protein
MSRLLIAAVAALFGVIVIGAIVLGAFPPHVQRKPVEHVIPNNTFHSH